jgi:hypothetical protein
MAFALAGIKVYPVKAHTPLYTKFLQVAQFTLTAANTDTAANLKTIAEASAVDGAKSLAAILADCEAVVSVLSDTSARVTTAAGAAYSFVSTTPTEPTLTFAGGGTTPTSQVITLVLAQKTDKAPVVYGV